MINWPAIAGSLVALVIVAGLIAIATVLLPPSPWRPALVVALYAIIVVATRAYLRVRRNRGGTA
jgi:hypothetical protein